jgi:ribosomal protein S18 acetylase RimI-like enzyme
MKTRQLSQDDIETLVDELWVPLANEMAGLSTYQELAPDAREQTIAHKQSLCEDSDSRTLVAEEHGNLLGYVSATIGAPPPIFERGPDLRIEELYVVESQRGQGIATQLLSRIQEWGESRNCDTASIGVNTSNEAAKHLYESLGFAKSRVTYRREMTE